MIAGTNRVEPRTDAESTTSSDVGRLNTNDSQANTKGPIFSISRMTQMARLRTYENNQSIEQSNNLPLASATSDSPATTTTTADKISALENNKSKQTPSKQPRRRMKSQPSILSFASSGNHKPSPPKHENDIFLKRFAVNNEDISEDNLKYHRLCFGVLAGTFVIDPAREFHYRWLFVISLAVCYNIIFIIGRGVFWDLHNLYPTTWYLIDYTCDLIYLFDMVANSRTGYLEQGILVRNTKKLARHYLQSYAFRLDLLSVLPTDIAYAFMTARCLPNQVPCAIIVRLNRLLRFHRLAQFFDRTESATNFPFVFRISKLLFYILVIIHWNACLYFAISYVIGFGSDHWVYQPLSLSSSSSSTTDSTSSSTSQWMDSKVQQSTSSNILSSFAHPANRAYTLMTDANPLSTLLRVQQPYDVKRPTSNANVDQQTNKSRSAQTVQNQTKVTSVNNLSQATTSGAQDLTNDSLVHQYIYCFYWSTLTLTTIGEVPMPERDEEYLFVVIDFLIGLLIFATIVGNIGSMITNMNAARADFQHKMDSVKQWMKFRKVNKELEDRIIKWFDYLWANRQTLDEEAVTAILPDRLKAETAIHVHLETLKRVQLFQDCEPGLLVQLVLKLKLQVFSPGDYICRVGDVGKEMYIVKRGELSVLAEDCRAVYGKLTDGSVFGELSILNISGVKTGNRRTANVRSVGYSDLFALSKQDLWNVLEDYPDAKTLLVEKGKQILRKDGLLLDDTISQHSTTATSAGASTKIQKPLTPSLYGLTDDPNQALESSESTASLSAGFLNQVGQHSQKSRPLVGTKPAPSDQSFRRRLRHRESCSNLLPIVDESRLHRQQRSQQNTANGATTIMKRRPIMQKSLSFALEKSRSMAQNEAYAPRTPFADPEAYFDPEASLSVSAASLPPGSQQLNALINLALNRCQQMEAKPILYGEGQTLVTNFIRTVDKLDELCNETRRAQVDVRQDLGRLEKILSRCNNGAITKFKCIRDGNDETQSPGYESHQSTANKTIVGDITSKHPPLLMDLPRATAIVSTRSEGCLSALDVELGLGDAPSEDWDQVTKSLLDT